MHITLVPLNGLAGPVRMPLRPLPRLILALVLAALPVSVSAEPIELVQSGYYQYANRYIAEIAANKELLSLIEKQNAANRKISQGQIDAQDKAWRADDMSFIEPILNNAMSKYLAGQVKASRGLVAEIIVMDNKGLNVGQWPKTTDYWQGDEDKFQKTYGAGATARFTDRVEFDDSTQRWLQQISKTVSIDGQPIGAITVGIDVAFMK